MVNRFEFVGTVTHSPEFLRTAAGTPFCFLRLSTKRFLSGQERQDFHFITIWSPAVQRVAEQVGIGDPVYVEGRVEASVSSRHDSTRANTIRLIASRVVPISVSSPAMAADVDEPVGSFHELPEHEGLS